MKGTASANTVVGEAGEENTFHSVKDTGNKRKKCMIRVISSRGDRHRHGLRPRLEQGTVSPEPPQGADRDKVSPAPVAQGREGKGEENKGQGKIWGI